MLPLDSTMADVVAVITMGTGVFTATAFSRIRTRISVLVLRVKSISAGTPPNVTVAMLSPWPNRFVPVMFTEERGWRERRSEGEGVGGSRTALTLHYLSCSPPNLMNSSSYPCHVHTVYLLMGNGMRN